MLTVRRSTLSLLLVGIGLIVLGGASALLLTVRADRYSQQPTSFSAIPVAVNYEAPAIELSDLARVPRRLADFGGRVVLVNLWATWCPPCQAEMPILQSFFEKHRDEGFTVVAIDDGDPEADVRAFVASYRLTFPVWLDSSYEASERAFKTSNLPSSYVIDRAGTVRLFWLGAINNVNLEKHVTPIIQETQ